MTKTYVDHGTSWVIGPRTILLAIHQGIFGDLHAVDKPHKERSRYFKLERWFNKGIWIAQRYPHDRSSTDGTKLIKAVRTSHRSKCLCLGGHVDKAGWWEPDTSDFLWIPKVDPSRTKLHIKLPWTPWTYSRITKLQMLSRRIYLFGSYPQTGCVARFL